ncbi:ABC transporter permease [Chloroflexota bacterium]
MRDYIIRRFILMIPTLFLVTVICFGTVRFIPGSVIDLMVSEMTAEGGATTVDITEEYVKHRLGLDVPIHVQYGRWVAGVFRGDLGSSMWTNEPVRDELIKRLPISIELGIFANLLALFLALPIGIYSAMRQDTLGDYTGRSISILCISLPSFWLGTMAIVFPSIWWNWSPPIIYIPLTEDLMGNLSQFILPGFILGMVFSGLIMRMTRTMMLEVLRQDYIRTAWAKGLTERVVVFRHALKNAMIPVITTAGTHIAIMIGGSVVLEAIFCLPGVGNYMVQALRNRDYPVISGINIVVTGWVLIMNLLIDLTYGWLDPRVHYK